MCCFDHSKPRKVGLVTLMESTNWLRTHTISMWKRWRMEITYRDKTAANIKEATPQGAMFQGRTCSTKYVEKSAHACVYMCMTVLVSTSEVSQVPFLYELCVAKWHSCNLLIKSSKAPPYDHSLEFQWTSETLYNWAQSGYALQQGGY